MAASKAEHLRKTIAKYAMRSGEEFKRGLPAVIREAHESGCWREERTGDGRPFKSFVEWLTMPPPPGCGLGSTPEAFTYDEVLQICETVAPDVAKVLASERPKGGKGGRPRKAQPETETLSAQTGFSKRSTTSAAVLASRLQQEQPKFYQAFLDGTYGSITSAAEAAGLVPHGHDPLKRLRQYWLKASKKQRVEFLEWIDSDEAQPVKRKLARA